MLFRSGHSPGLLHIMRYDDDRVGPFEVEELIRQLKGAYTVVIVTHNMQQAGRVAEKTVFFLQGRVIEEGETRQFFSHPQKKETEDYVSGRFS